MITRYNLVQAIYDNDDEWSCQSPCPHTMEEVKPECVCYTCAEHKLKEYEDSICRQTIEECMENIIPTLDENGVDKDVVDECIRYFNAMAERMKGETE